MTVPVESVQERTSSVVRTRQSDGARQRTVGVLQDTPIPGVVGQEGVLSAGDQTRGAPSEFTWALTGSGDQFGRAALGANANDLLVSPVCDRRAPVRIQTPEAASILLEGV